MSVVVLALFVFTNVIGAAGIAATVVLMCRAVASGVRAYTEEHERDPRGHQNQ